MEDIDVNCFVYIYGGYRCILFCLHLWRISMYFRLFTFMEDIDVFSFCSFCFVYIYGGYRCTFMEDIDVICFVYIYGGYRCSSFCLHLWRISMSFCLPFCGISTYFRLFTFMEGIDCIFVCLHLCRISMYFLLFTFM